MHFSRARGPSVHIGEDIEGVVVKRDELPSCDVTLTRKLLHNVKQGAKHIQGKSDNVHP